MNLANTTICINEGSYNMTVELIKLLARVCKKIYVHYTENINEELEKLENVEHFCTDKPDYKTFNGSVDFCIILNLPSYYGVLSDTVSAEDFEKFISKKNMINLKLIREFKPQIVTHVIPVYMEDKPKKEIFTKLLSSYGKTAIDEFCNKVKLAYMIKIFNTFYNIFELSDSTIANRIYNCLESDSGDRFIPTLNEIFSSPEKIYENSRSYMMKLSDSWFYNTWLELKSKTETIQLELKENVTSPEPRLVVNPNKSTESTNSQILNVKVPEKDKVNDLSGEREVAVVPECSTSGIGDLESIEKSKTELENKVVKVQRPKLKEEEELDELNKEVASLRERVVSLENEKNEYKERETKRELLKECKEKFLEAFKTKFRDDLSCTDVVNDVMEKVDSGLCGLSRERLKQLTEKSEDEISEFWVSDSRSLEDLTPTHRMALTRMFYIVRGFKTSIGDEKTLFEILKTIHHESCPDCIVDRVIRDDDIDYTKYDEILLMKIFKSMEFDNIELNIL